MRYMIPLLILFVTTPADAGASTRDALGVVWLISTRRASRVGRLDAADNRISFSQFQGDRRWKSIPRDQLLARPIPTAVFVHGNLTGPNLAVSRGWHLYRRMKRMRRPFRLIVWSWPSERIYRRIRPDAQTKGVYCDGQAYYLAAFLRRIHPDTSVCLIGYSYGARVITGALHLLGGGQVAGRHLPVQEDAVPDDRRPVRAILVAAALDANSLRPNHRNGLALSQVESMLITTNCFDRALRWYPLLYRRGGLPALGFNGPLGRPDSQKVELLNASRSVGRSHRWLDYIESTALQRRLAKYTFLDTP